MSLLRRDDYNFNLKVIDAGLDRFWDVKIQWKNFEKIVVEKMFYIIFFQYEYALHIH